MSRIGNPVKEVEVEPLVEPVPPEIVPENPSIVPEETPEKVPA